MESYSSSGQLTVCFHQHFISSTQDNIFSFNPSKHASIRTRVHEQEIHAHAARYSGGAQHITASPVHSATCSLNTSGCVAVKAPVFLDQRLVWNVVCVLKNTFGVMRND